MRKLGSRQLSKRAADREGFIASSVGVAFILFLSCCECDDDIRRDTYVMLCSGSTNSKGVLEKHPVLPTEPKTEST